MESLVTRGLRGAEFIGSGLRAAWRSFSGGIWRHFGFHFARNAICHGPKLEIRKCIGEEPRALLAARTPAKAKIALPKPIRQLSRQRAKAGELAWGVLAPGPFCLHAARAAALPTSHLEVDRAHNQAGVEVPHRKGQGLPERNALMQTVNAILVEEWASGTKAQIKWGRQDA